MQRSCIKIDLICHCEKLNKLSPLLGNHRLNYSPNEAFNRIDQEFL